MTDRHSDPDRPDPDDLQARDRRVLDRELDELTSELRTAIPGVTVLFAFLLTVPFAAGFPGLSGSQRAAYFIAFLATTFSVIFLVGESAYHRVRGKPYDKGLLLRTATRQAVTGLALLAVALCAVVFLVTDVLFGSTVSTVLRAGVAVLAGATWFGLPLLRRLQGDRRAPQPLVTGRCPVPSGTPSPRRSGSTPGGRPERARGRPGRRPRR